MDCIYHHQRSQFDCIQKGLRKLKLLPKIYADRLAMAVCSCRRKNKSTNSEIVAERPVMKSALLEDLQQDKWDSYPDSRQCLEDLANRLYHLTPSELTLVQVVYQSLCGNHSIVMEEVRPRKKVRKQRCKTSPNILHIILKKKKKSYSSEEVILPMFGGNSRELISNFDNGLFGLGKEHGCIAEIDGTKTRVFMDKGQQKTVMNIWYQDYAKFQTLRNLLVLKAQQIQTNKSTRHRVRCKTIDYDEAPGDFLEGFLDQKTRKSDDFDKKDYKDRKHNASRHYGKMESSPLNGSRCLNCLKEYEFEKATSENVCKYHTGYTTIYKGYSWIGYVWSCCNAETDVTKPTHSTHSSTGCSTGKHNWRPHKRASRAMKSEKMLLN